jgi:hypothetical protein
MSRHGIKILLAMMALSAAVPAGRALAGGNGDDFGAEKVGKVRFIDRSLNLFILDDGTEFRTTDARMLDNLKEGAWVEVDYSDAAGRNVVNFIEPATPDTVVGVTPNTGDSHGVH